GLWACDVCGSGDGVGFGVVNQSGRDIDDRLFGAQPQGRDERVADPHRVQCVCVNGGPSVLGAIWPTVAPCRLLPMGFVSIATNQLPP
ncbi:MAG: hypothetical protein ACKVIQ_15535, partial [Acidimicrobiales bacterium]